MSKSNSEIINDLKYKLDGTQEQQEHAAKILCGLNPLDDWDKLDLSDIEPLED